MSFQFTVYFKEYFCWRCYPSIDDTTFAYVSMNIASVTPAIQTLQARSQNGCGECNTHNKSFRSIRGFSLTTKVLFCDHYSNLNFACYLSGTRAIARSLLQGCNDRTDEVNKLFII